MFRSRFHLPMLFLFAAYSICGCAPSKVGLELAEYVNQGMLSISQLETKALERYGAATGVNYTTDQAVYDALKMDVIPLYDRFVVLLKQIRPQSEEVLSLHAVYVTGAETMLSGFNSKLQALEKKDASLMQSANALIEKGRIETEIKWHEQLQALYKAHGVRPAPETKDSALKRQLIEPPRN